MTLASKAWHRALACSVKLGDWDGAYKDGVRAAEFVGRTPVAFYAPVIRWMATLGILAGDLPTAEGWLAFYLELDALDERSQLEKIKGHFPLAHLAAAEGHGGTAAEILVSVLPWTTELGATRYVRLASEAYFR